jgi:electron transport complex protein RnfE
MPQAPNHKPLTTTRVAALLLLCPLLAVSDSVINALGLGSVAILVTIAASIPLSVALKRLPEYGRIAVAVAIISAVVTCAVLIANAYFHKLYIAIGAFLPLLLSGGILLARYEVAGVEPSTGTQRSMLLTGLRTGFTFAAVLLGLGAVREFVGHGSLLFGAEALPIYGVEQLTVQVFDADLGFVLATLPPGAFIAMGMLFAARNWFRQRSGAR